MLGIGKRGLLAGVALVIVAASAVALRRSRQPVSTAANETHRVRDVYDRQAARYDARLLEPLATRYTGDHLFREPLDHLAGLGFSIEYCARSRAGLVERVVARKPDADGESMTGGYGNA